VKKKAPTKPHKVFSSVLWIWIAICILAPFLPSTNAVHNLFGYPPPVLLCIPALLAILAVLARFLTRRGNRLDIVNFVASLVSSFIIVGFQIPLPLGSVTGQPVRVLTINAEKDNRTAPGLRDFILERKLDVVMMQEVKGGDKSPAAMLLRELPDWHIATVGEVAILSRWPLTDVRSIPLRSLPGRFVLSATVGSPQPFRAMTTHWSVPQISRGLGSLSRTVKTQSYDYEDTMEAVGKETLPVILGGDFNNPPRQGLSRMMSDRMEDAFSSRGFGPGWTYPAHRPLVRIDHLFSNKGIKPIHAEVGPSFGSDHRSIYAEFALFAGS